MDINRFTESMQQALSAAQTKAAATLVYGG